MEKLLNSQIAKYVLYFIMFKIWAYFLGFETIMLMIGAYILVDIEFYDKNKDKDGKTN